MSTILSRLAAGAVTLMLAAAIPVAAFAQGTEEQQQACTGDAVKLCSDTIPDIPKTTACMKAHFAQLNPRCQAAFSDATGGAKTKAASRKAEPRTRDTERETSRETTRATSRAERRAAERAGAAPSRSSREAALPPRDEPASREAPASRDGFPPESDIVPAQTPGYPPFPSPDGAYAQAAPAPSNSPIAQACRAGLIDAFTCQTTVPALIGR